MKYKNVFWGVILITAGVLIAMRNLDIFHFSLRGIFHLWPLIFVFWGIALLPIKALGKIGLTAVTVFVGILILINHPNPHNNWRFNWYNNDNYSIGRDRDRDRNDSETSPWTHQQFEEDYDHNYNVVDLYIDAAAGEFELRGVTSNLFEFQTEGNVGSYSVVTTNNNDSTARIDFGHENFSARHNFKNEVNMQLNDEPIWNFDIDIGAAKLELDLRPFKVESINIDGGASAIKLKMGDAFKKTFINIDAGAAGIEIKVPYGSAVEVRTETFLSGKDLDDFIKIKNGLYQTPNFSDSTAQIFIDIDAAISGVKVTRY